VVHDHIALRTFDDPRIIIDMIARVFTENGYEARGNYDFKVKKPRGQHFEHKSDPTAPKVFISELLTDKFSKNLQTIIRDYINRLDNRVYADPDLVCGGSVWGKIPYATCTKLREESEYAAERWSPPFGIHFPITTFRELIKACRYKADKMDV